MAESSERYFNIALLPIDLNFQEVFSRLAGQFYETIADGYMLGVGALAHITLCQFHAATDAQARSVFHSWQKETTIKLSLGSFQLRDGTGEHAGKCWAEFLIEKTPELIELQKHCVEFLKQKNFKTLTSVDNYSPHITLARISTRSIARPRLDNKLIEYKTAIGISTATGVFVREL